MSRVTITPTSHRQTGFTLVEVLIALVLTAMLASLLVSAVFFASRTRVSVEQDVGAQLQRQTDYSRFEQTLKYCLPELQTEPALFRGTPSLVECLSTQTLQDKALPVPMNIRWTILGPVNGQSQLKYADQSNWDKTIEVTQLTGKARFVYWDVKGNRRNDWEFEPRQPRFIPARITIEFDEQPQQNGLWSAVLRATPHPDLPPPTFLGTTIQ